MKKYLYAGFLLIVGFPSYGETGSEEKPDCGKYFIPKEESYPDNKFGKSMYVSTVLPTSTVYFTFSGGLTTQTLSSSQCEAKGIGGTDLETREKLYFLTFSGRHMMQETGRRSGEYADALTEILGCTQERDKFFESAAGHHTDIFREEEYGLSYAVRLNRLLDAAGLCRETPVRSFLREADITLSASNPSFPALPR